MPIVLKVAFIIKTENSGGYIDNLVVNTNL